MTPTPHQIAREAAEAILLPRTRCKHPDPNTDNELRVEEITALILSAAARIVRESGVIASLEHMARQRLIKEMSAVDYEMGDIDFAYDKLIEESRLTLASLRPLLNPPQDQTGPVVIFPSETPRILTEDELRRGIITVGGGGSGGAPK